MCLMSAYQLMLLQPCDAKPTVKRTCLPAFVGQLNSILGPWHIYRAFCLSMLILAARRLIMYISYIHVREIRRAMPFNQGRKQAVQEGTLFIDLSRARWSLACTFSKSKRWKLVGTKRGTDRRTGGETELSIVRRWLVDCLDLPSVHTETGSSRSFLLWQVTLRIDFFGRFVYQIGNTLYQIGNTHGLLWT